MVRRISKITLDPRWCRRVLRGSVAGLVLAGVSLSTLPSASANVWTRASLPSATAFGFTDGTQSYTVPADVCAVVLDVAGAAGGEDYFETAGGPGGTGQATVVVAPGEQLTVLVGGEGSEAPAIGGYNGGGATASGDGAQGGSGGGATDVLVTSTSTVLLEAGGGGGQGFDNGAGGAGGTGGDANASGTDGAAAPALFGSAGGGGGATVDAVGSGGTAGGSSEDIVASAGEPGVGGTGGQGGAGQ